MIKKLPTKLESEMIANISKKNYFSTILVKKTIIIKQLKNKNIFNSNRIKIRSHPIVSSLAMSLNKDRGSTSVPATNIVNCRFRYQVSQKWGPKILAKTEKK